MYGFWKGSESRQKCSAIELSSDICYLGRWITKIQLCLSFHIYKGSVKHHPGPNVHALTVAGITIAQ